MKTIILILCCLVIILFVSFNNDERKAAWQSIRLNSAENRIGEIHLPKGFERMAVPENNFGEWLRTVPLKRDNIVRLYNSTPTERQDLHYAILDISTGNKDLQQCADAIMRLKAEYYFSKKEYTNITFPRGDSKTLSFNAYALEHGKCYTHDCLLNFMEKVFAQCGTYTVAAMTKSVPLQTIQPGDVFVKAGAPGHAMIVADVAENKATHQTIYLLAQSFMPAQDMHIVINPTDETLSPWYAVNGNAEIVTPSWAFTAGQLKRWK